MRHFTLFFLVCLFGQTVLAQAVVEPITPFDYSTNYRDVHVDVSGNGWAVGTCSVLARTENNGQDWTLLDAPEGRDFHAVACQPGTDCQTIFLGTEGLVFRSTDGGETWSSTEVAHFRAREFHFLDNNVVLLSHDDQSLYRSTDGGDTWSNIPLAHSYRGTAHFPTATTGYVFQQGGPLLKSTDAGATWDSVYLFESNAYYGTWLDEDTGYVYNQASDLLKTTDGGSNWTAVNTESLPGNVRYLAALSETELIAYVFASNVFRSTDGGMTWQNNTNIGPGLYQTGLRYTGIHRNGANFWIASWANEILYSTDGLETAASLFPAERPSLEQIVFPSEQIGYALQERRGMLKTTDGGDTWATVVADFFTVSRDFLVLDEQTVIIPFNTSGPQKTEDGGQTWAALLPADLQDTVNLFAIEQLPGGRICLYGSAHALYSDDNGESWNFVYHGLFNFPRSMVFLNDQIGFVGSDAGRVVATTDGGETWSLVLDGDFTNQPIRNLFALDESTIMMTSSGTSRCSTDGGLSWSTEACNGVSTPGDIVVGPDGAWYASDLQSSSQDVLTEISRSMDQGQSWEIIAEHCTYALAGTVRPDNRYLYLYADGGFISRIDLETITSVRSEIASIGTVMAYPNPTSGLLNIELPTNAANVQIDLYDLQGQLLQSQRTNEAITLLDLTTLPAGCYVVRVQGDGWLQTGRVFRLE